MVLAALCRLFGEKFLPDFRKGWAPGLLLFLYALPFTFAYVDLPVGTGALILFGGVQITMILAAIRAGHRPSALEWAGVVLAFAGLVWLTAPGVHAPPAGSSALMAVAGIAWGLYTMRGKRSGSPLADTAGNFILAAMPSVIIGGTSLPGSRVHAEGVWLGIASGALASGLGYAIWYRALRGLTPVRAAVVQLATPVLAAAAGVALLSETAPPRLFISGALVLGGIGLTIFAHTIRRLGG